MGSRIDPSRPADLGVVVKADIRANLQALRDEIGHAGFYDQATGRDKLDTLGTALAQALANAAAHAARLAVLEDVPDSPGDWPYLVGAGGPAPRDLLPGDRITHTEDTDAGDSDWLPFRFTVPSATTVEVQLDGGNPSTDVYWHQFSATWQRPTLFATSKDTSEKRLLLQLAPGNYGVGVFSVAGPRARYTVTIVGVGEARDTGPGWTDVLASGKPAAQDLAIGATLASEPETIFAGDSDFPLRFRLTERARVVLALTSGNGFTELQLYGATTDWASIAQLASTVGASVKSLDVELDVGNYAVGATAAEGAPATLGVSASATTLADVPPVDSADTGPSWSAVLATGRPAAQALVIGGAVLVNEPETITGGDSDFPLRFGLTQRAKVTLALVSGNEATDLYLHRATGDWSSTTPVTDTRGKTPKTLAENLDPGNYALGAWAASGGSAELRVTATATVPDGPVPEPTGTSFVPELPAPGRTDRLVNTAADLEAACRDSQPGWVIRVKNGTYAGWHAHLPVNASYPSQPVWVVPETPGGVTFTDSAFGFVEPGLVWRGFRHVGLGPNSTKTYQGRAIAPKNATIRPMAANCRLERCLFEGLRGANDGQCGVGGWNIEEYFWDKSANFLINYCDFIECKGWAFSFNGKHAAPGWRMSNCFWYWPPSFTPFDSYVGWAGQEGGGGSFESPNALAWKHQNGFLMDHCLWFGNPIKIRSVQEWKLSASKVRDCIMTTGTNSYSSPPAHISLIRLGRDHEVTRCFFEGMWRGLRTNATNADMSDTIAIGGNNGALYMQLTTYDRSSSTQTQTQTMLNWRVRRCTLIGRNGPKGAGRVIQFTTGNSGQSEVGLPPDFGYAANPMLYSETPKDNVFERVHLHVDGSGGALFNETSISGDPYANQKLSRLLSSDNQFVNNTQFGPGGRPAWGTELANNPLSYENRIVRPPTGYQNLSLTLRVPRVSAGAGADPDVVFKSW